MCLISVCFCVIHTLVRKIYSFFFFFQVVFHNKTNKQRTDRLKGISSNKGYETRNVDPGWEIFSQIPVEF